MQILIQWILFTHKKKIPFFSGKQALGIEITYVMLVFVQKMLLILSRGIRKHTT